MTESIKLTEQEEKAVEPDEEEIIEDEVDRLRVPRSGKRKLMPIEKL